MTISAHQPAYLPWYGYLKKIAESDVFVYLDTVQFEKNSFTNRNLIKSVTGKIWLTVPVLLNNHFQVPMNQIKIDNKIKWKDKHLKTIYYNYKKAPYFEENYDKLLNIYQKEFLTLHELCVSQLKFWNNEFAINSKIVLLSDLGIMSSKSDLIFEICKKLGAKKYLSGALGVNYLDEKKFIENKIEIEYQNIKHPIYKQLYGDFIPNLSVIDFWMNTKLKF